MSDDRQPAERGGWPRVLWEHVLQALVCYGWMWSGYPAIMPIVVRPRVPGLVVPDDLSGQEAAWPEAFRPPV